MSHRVVVVGSCTIDQNRGRGHGRAVSSVGGTVVYSGLTYARLGGEVRVVTRIAAADERILEPLRAGGIDVQVEPSTATTRFVNEYDGDRRTQTLPSVALPIGPSAVQAAAEEAALIHLGALHPRDVRPGAERAARAAGARVALDVQAYTRARVGEEVIAKAARTLATHLQAADVVKGDAEEIELVAAACGRTPVELVSTLGLEVLLETRASRGGRLYAADGEVVEWRAPVVDGDPTGAGDVFLAAFLWWRLEGAELAEAADEAARVTADHVAGRWLDREALVLD